MRAAYGLVDAAVVAAYEAFAVVQFLAVLALGNAFVGIDPHQGAVEFVDEAAVAHGGRGLQLAVVEPFGGEAHQLFVHAVLHGEHGYALGFVGSYLLHEGGAEALALGYGVLDGGRQLLMVAGKDYSVSFLHGYPAGGLHGLGCLVDEERMPVLSLQ